jgi:SAM-dependent methyltransferase
MNILELNKAAWNAIGSRVASPYIDQPKYRRAFKTFCEYLTPGAQVLDVGCGPGLPITKLLVDQGFDVTGLDFAERMIAIARKNVSGARFVCTSITDIQYSSYFDGIVASYSLLCLDPDSFRRASENIKTALKFGGHCFVALNERIEGKRIKSDWLSTISDQRMYSRAYSEQEVTDSFSGLRVVSVTRDVIKSKMFGTERSLILLLKKETR